MTEPKVSIIITTYFRNEFLREALESVLKTTYDQVEIVVVDDSGEAYAEPVIAEFSDVGYIPLTENRGAQEARNVGIKETEGKYVQLLDDDDQLKPTKIAQQCAVLESSVEIGVMYCGVEWGDGRVDLPDEDARGKISEQALSFSMYPCSTSTMLIRRSELDAITPLKPLPGADDIDTIIRLSERTKFDYIDQALVCRRNIDNSRGDAVSVGALNGRRQILRDHNKKYNTYQLDVKQRALASIYYREGMVQLERRIWSPKAIFSFLQLVYYTPKLKITHLGIMLASFFGRPGIKMAQIIYHSVIDYI